MSQFTSNVEVDVTGTVDTSGAKRVGLDPEGIGMLMSILSNQYSNKHRAVLREYFCNGWDSHLEAGNPAPVVITLPNELQPSLLIQDSGVGLAEDDMLSVFGTYTRSTKRKGRDQIDVGQRATGGFGIGSKSAWSMGQQFIVTGVKDGRKTVALFALDDEGIGTCDIIRSVDTDEPNGVLISLSVPDVPAMLRAADRFFETVDEGTALVDGVLSKPIWDSLRQVNDATYVRPDHEGKVFVVMGQVCYEVDSEIMESVSKRLAETDAAGLSAALSHWNESTSIYFRLPMDSVTVHPSRERLRDTNVTINALVAAVTSMSVDLTSSVQDAVSAAPSYYRAAGEVEKVISEMDAFKISRKGLLYAGLPVPKTVTVDLPSAVLTTKSRRATTKIVRNDLDPITLEFTQAEQVLVVTGVKDGERGKVTRFVKRFLEEAPEGQGITRVFMAETVWGAEGWFAWGTENGAKTMTLEEYKAALKALRTVSPRTVNEPSYTVGWWEDAQRDLDMRDLLSDIISEGKDIILFSESSRVSPFARSVLENDYTPIVLLPTQSERMLRKRVEEDGSVEIFDGDWNEIVKAEAVKRFTITDAEKDALSARAWLKITLGYWWADKSREHWSEDMLKSLGGREKVTSPRLLAIVDEIALARLIADDITEVRANEVEAMKAYVDLKVPAYGASLPEKKATSFPLLEGMNQYSLRNNKRYKADVLEYVNSKA